MSEGKTRVAALQFASGTDVGENLVTCLRMIDEAAVHCPDVMVLPEFCNHISWYEDADHAWRVAVELEGSFLEAVAARARQHDCYIVINVSLRNTDGLITVTSLMYSPCGARLARADKQTLMGHENTWFTRADTVGDVVDAPFGKVGIFPCRDGVTFETPRCLALRGVQLFCDSLNSFALDEASLHVPARAPENRCFLVAANKVGPLIPANVLEAVSAETHIPVKFLYGAGESQIVSPAGEVLARGPRDEEAVVWADIELEQALDKRREDGTDIVASRRPEIYTEIAEAPEQAQATEPVASAQVATLVPSSSGKAALAELPDLISRISSETRVAVLPEMFCLSWEEVDFAVDVIDALAASLQERRDLLLCTSLPLPAAGGSALAAVLVGADGLVFRQDQLHANARLPGLSLADEFKFCEVEWGRVCICTADDMRYPEIAKLAAIKGAHLLLVPGVPHPDWEAAWALPSRAAENRMCVVYSSEHGQIANLTADFTLMTSWRERSFDGYINQPLITRVRASVTEVQLNLGAAANKLMSEQTDLIADRPWHLSGGIVAELAE
ncbi:carbon-nitrogen hydrolase family protein [Halioglobus maricola]|uniref:carbon-nitrogen hydrolase family protein n=1 Tax=Halioglobus maricola TaxID=2601894 RepID=UPI0014789BCA|nr:carbon-nitrogen hydrolase family protein [Halioglobus maricola]